MEPENMPEPVEVQVVPVEPEVVEVVEAEPVVEPVIGPTE